MENQANKGHIAIKKTQVKKRGLSEFKIKLKSSGGALVGGEVSCTWSGHSQTFCDANELMRFIESQCDGVWYPQSQRKLRGWPDHV